MARDPVAARASIDGSFGLSLEVEYQGGVVTVPWPRGIPSALATRTLGRLGARVSSSRRPFVVPELAIPGAVVVGIGDEGKLASSVYAAARGRQLLWFDDPEAFTTWFAGAETRSVFAFAPEACLTLERSMRLVRSSCRGDVLRPLGIMPVPAHLDAAAVMAARLAALAARRDPFARRLIAFVDQRERPAGVRYGYADGEADEFARVMEETAEVAILRLHSNGADFRLGASVLCVQADALRPAPGRVGERFLPCQAGGPCLRTFHSPRAFVGASQLKVGLAIFLSCNVFLPAGGILDPRFGFVDALLRGDHVRGLVASFTSNVAEPDWVSRVAALVEEGCPLGALAARISQAQEPGTESYLCLGDPENVLSPGAPTTRAMPAKAPTPSPRPPLGALVQADLVRTHLAQAATTVSEEHALERRLRTAATLRFSDPSRPAAQPDVDRSLARFAALATVRGEALEARWRPGFARGRAVRGGAPCPACAAPVTTARFRSLLYQDYARELARCPRHGVLRDRPAGERGRDRDAPILRVTRSGTGLRCVATLRGAADGVLAIGVESAAGDLLVLDASTRAGVLGGQRPGDAITLVVARAAGADLWLVRHPLAANRRDARVDVR